MHASFLINNIFLNKMILFYFYMWHFITCLLDKSFIVHIIRSLPNLSSHSLNITLSASRMSFHSVFSICMIRSDTTVLDCWFSDRRKPGFFLGKNIIVEKNWHQDCLDDEKRFLPLILPFPYQNHISWDAIILGMKNSCFIWNRNKHRTFVRLSEKILFLLLV